MKCKLCEKPLQRKLCTSCEDYLKWKFPNEAPQDIAEKIRGQEQ